MNIDIGTFVLVLGITHLIQVAVFYQQYKINKTYQGVGWWLLWSIAEIVGFAGMLLRGIPEIHSIAIIFQNVGIFLGVIFIYIGMMRFLDRKENPKIIFSVSALFIIAIVYFVYVDDNAFMRYVIFNAAVAGISFLTAYVLFVHKMPSITTSAHFNAAIFLVHGGVFAYRTVMFLLGAPVDDFFRPTLFNYLPVLDALIVSLLWTYGFIIMLNQRLNAEMKEAKEHFELIFNTSPDASLITRLTDGVVVNVNDGFTALTGFLHDEAIGKSTLAVNIWKNPEDRQKVVDDLRQKGLCENFEAVFLRKDGSQAIGLLSANIITLRNIPHIVSITRDITKRKQAEAALRQEQQFSKSVLDSLPGIFYLYSYPEHRLVLWNKQHETLLGYTTEEMKDRFAMDWHLPEVKDAVLKATEEVMEKGHSSVESSLVAKDGHLIPFFLTGVRFEAQGRLFYMGIGIDITDRKRTEEALRESENRYRELSIIDDLTQLYNSRHFYHQLRMEIDRVDRYGQPLTLLLLDLDDFKAFNDAHGHVEGDQVLMRLGQVVKKCLRQTDSAYRYGGEEFTILLPMTASADAAITAERIRAEFKKETFSPAPDQDVHVTVSIGLAQYKPQEDMKAFVHRVDQLMYQGKKNGKDRICCVL